MRLQLLLGLPMGAAAFVGLQLPVSTSKHCMSCRRGRCLQLVSGTERDNPYIEELKATARRIGRRGRGILASDESNATTGKRLNGIGVENTEDNRRAWRELLYTTPQLGTYISGAILFEETLYQKSAAGVPFVDILRDQGIDVGIKWPEVELPENVKLNSFPAPPTAQLGHIAELLQPAVDTGLQPIFGTDGETATQGLDGLGQRCARYYEQGARFAKWRAVIKVNDRDLPSDRAVEENAHGLARYAAIAQENGLVPIVEPEVTLGEGDYSIERTAYISERVNTIVMGWLNRYEVILDAILLKPNMVLPGLDAPIADKHDVARYTVQVCKRSIPPAVPSIHFLSGGMGASEATDNLQQLQVEYPDAPWSLTFSYGRALQDPTLKTWAGKAENVKAAQQMLFALAKANGEAQQGKYQGKHPAPGGGRILQALRLGGAGK